MQNVVLKNKPYFDFFFILQPRGTFAPIWFFTPFSFRFRIPCTGLTHGHSDRQTDERTRHVIRLIKQLN